MIVPLYQVERFVAQCVESLRGQTLGDFEAICVDDGSTDRSLEVARAAAAGDARFSFHALPENRGQSAARNAALDLARGRIVMLLDADDYLLPDALEKIAARFEEQQLDELYFNAESFYDSAEAHRRVVEDFSQRPSFPDVATGPELFAFFEERRAFMPHGALRAVRRSLIEEAGIRFREGIIHEDLLFTLETLVRARRSSFLNEVLYMRRIHTGSTMGTKRRSMRNIVGHLESVRFMRSWTREHVNEVSPAVIAAMAHRIEDYLNLCAIDYVRDVTPEEKAAFLATLSPDDRFEFELDVVQRGSLLDEIYQSKTYRAEWPSRQRKYPPSPP